MPSKQSKFLSHPLLDTAVTKYQQSHGLKSFSAAATELLIHGIEYWLNNLTENPLDAHWGANSQEQAQLLKEFHQWEGEVLAENGWTEFTDLTEEQCQQLTFERFILLKVMPKHGGKRNSAGRKKESAE